MSEVKKGFDEHVKNHGADVLFDNGAMTVIKDGKLGVRAFAFYEGSDNQGVGADGPCLVHFGENWLSVTDPTGERDCIKLVVWQELEITEICTGIDYDIRDNRTYLTVDTAGSCGKEFALKFNAYNPTAKYRVNYTDEEYDEFVKMSEDGLTAAFIYTNKLLHKGKSCVYNETDRKERAIAKGGAIYVPVSFYEKFVGVSISGVDASLGYTLDGKKYVNALGCAAALGLCADTFYENRLFVIGTEAQLDKIRSNPNLEEAGAYALFGNYDASGFTSEDYTYAKDLWRLRLVGSPEINDMSDDAIAAKVRAFNTKCQQALEQYNRNPDRVILWGDTAPVESADLTAQYSKIADLARGWGAYGCEKYHDTEVLATIIDALEWMYENMYGDAEIEGRGWRNVREFNWWDWFFGGPDHLTNAMLIIEEHLTPEQKAKYLKCYKWVRTIMYAAPNDRSGSASRTTPGAKCALLLEDREYLERLQLDCDNSMGLVEYGRNVHKADYVNWTHSMPHNISYGVINLQRALFVASILSSTPLDISGPKAYNQYNLIKYCFEPAMYRAQGFVMFSGRSTFASEQGLGLSVLSAALPMVGRFGEDEDAYIKRFIKRHASTEDIIKRLKAGCSIYECAKLNAILADDTISSENDYEYAHAWFTGDRAAQHRRDYAIGIAMSSRREQAYECINGANKTGWHTGDGATYIYTTYDGNQYDGKNFIFNENVAYRFPGTTEDSQPRVARSISGQYHWIPENTFAGSIQLYDKYIAAAMDFGAFHNEGPDVHPDDYGHGGSNPTHFNDLKAKKAWFCLGEELVCLGAGITSSMNSPVNTTVEHRRIVKPETDNQYADGVLLPKESYDNEYDSVSHACIAGHAGYVFFDKKAYIRRYEENEATAQTFFEIGIAHGANPEDASYAYAILPYADNARLESYVKEPNVEIISNTRALQAVRDKSIGLSSYVFHEAGECDGIAVSAPCILALGECDGELTLSVTDPTHKLEKLTVTLDGEHRIVTKNPKISVTSADGVTVIEIKTFGAHGRKFEVKYS